MEPLQSGHSTEPVAAGGVVHVAPAAPRRGVPRRWRKLSTDGKEAGGEGEPRRSGQARIPKVGFALGEVTATARQLRIFVAPPALKGAGLRAQLFDQLLDPLFGTLLLLNERALRVANRALVLIRVSALKLKPRLNALDLPAAMLPAFTGPTP